MGSRPEGVGKTLFNPETRSLKGVSSSPRLQRSPETKSKALLPVLADMAAHMGASGRDGEQSELQLAG
jgi:hypothetical protein